MKSFLSLTTGSKFGELLNFSSAHLLVVFINLAAGLVSFAILPPEEIGIWRSLLLVNQYASILSLGIVSNGLLRELSFAQGRGDYEFGNRLTETSLFFTLLLVLFFTIATLVTLWFVRDNGMKYVVGAAAVGTLLSFGFYRQYLAVVLRATQSFATLSHILWFESILSLLSIGFIPWLGFYGLVLRKVLILVVITVITYVKRPDNIHPRFHRDSFQALFKTGFPLFGLVYLREKARTAPRLILLLVGGVELVGLYAPAETLFGLVRTLSVPLRRYFHPKLAHRFGMDGDSTSIRNFSQSLMLKPLLGAAPLSIAGWFAIPPLFHQMFPDYVSAIPVAQLNLIAGSIALGTISVVALEAMRKIRALTLFTVATLVFGAVCPLFFVQFMSPLLGVGWGQITSSCLLLVFLYILIRFATTSDKKVASTNNKKPGFSP